jgi:hypothetical protein
MFRNNYLGDTLMYISIDNYPFNICNKIQNNIIEFVDFDHSQNNSYRFYEKSGVIRIQEHNLIRKMKNGIEVIFLDEINFIKDTLLVTFSMRVVSINKNKLRFSVSDWGVFQYIYSIETKSWILIKREYGGI